MSKQLTRQQAISAHCKDCIWDEGAMGAGTWKKQVTDCTAYDCNLYPYRPVDSQEAATRTQDKIDKMTPEELEAYKRKGDNFREKMHDKTPAFLM